MKNLKKIKSFFKYSDSNVSVFLVLMLSVMPHLLNAQPTFPSNPAPAPIDSGLILLAAASFGYAWKKIKDKKYESENGVLEQKK